MIQKSSISCGSFRKDFIRNVYEGIDSVLSIVYQLCTHSQWKVSWVIAIHWIQNNLERFLSFMIFPRFGKLKRKKVDLSSLVQKTNRIIRNKVQFRPCITRNEIVHFVWVRMHRIWIKVCSLGVEDLSRFQLLFIYIRILFLDENSLFFQMDKFLHWFEPYQQDLIPISRSIWGGNEVSKRRYSLKSVHKICKSISHSSDFY